MHKILVIDDSPNTCEYVKVALEACGDFEVSAARNGKEGLKVAHKIKPSLIILDLIMPEMDGYEVLKALKKDRKSCRVPVIVLSGRQDRDAVKESMYLYADIFLPKPVGSRELEQHVRKLLGLTE